MVHQAHAPSVAKEKAAEKRRKKQERRKYSNALVLIRMQIRMSGQAVHFP